MAARRKSVTPMPVFLELPEEILRTIIAYLDFDGRKCLRAACNYLRRLVNEDNFVQREITIINYQHPVGQLANDRHYFNLKFYETETEQRPAILMEKIINCLRLPNFSSGAKTGSLFCKTNKIEINVYCRGVSSSMPHVYKLLNHSPVLKCLHFKGFNTKHAEMLAQWLKSRPQTLTELSILFSVRDFEVDRNSEFANEFTRQFQNLLKNLHLAPKLATLSLTPNMGILPAQLPLIENLVHLQKLYISNMGVNSPFGCGDPGIIHYSGADASLCAIIPHLKHLTHLDVSDTRAADELGELVNNMPQLVALNVSHCQNRFKFGFSGFATTMHHLIDLRLSGINIEEDVLETAVKNAPNLWVLDTSGNYDLGNRTVENIAKYCRNLRSLSLYSCTSVSDISSLSDLPYLNQLDIRRVKIPRIGNNTNLPLLETLIADADVVRLNELIVATYDSYKPNGAHDREDPIHATLIAGLHNLKYLINYIKYYDSAQMYHNFENSKQLYRVRNIPDKIPIIQPHFHEEIKRKIHREGTSNFSGCPGWSI